MALPKFTNAADIISQLDDQPNDNDGLSADQLKAKFDQFAMEFKAYMNNTLIPELENQLNEAALGITPQAGTITTNAIADSAITTAKIKDGNITNAKLATNAISDFNKIATGTIPLNRLTETAQNTINGKLNASAYVIDSSLSGSSTNPVQNKVVKTALDGKQSTLTFDSSPTSSSTNPVTSGGIYTALGNKQNTLTFDISPTQGNYSPHVVSSGVVYTQLAAKQPEHKTASASVAANAWDSDNEASVSISGVTGSNTIIVRPTPATYDRWSNAGIRCISQSSGSITLKAITKPTQSVTAQVLIFD